MTGRPSSGPNPPALAVLERRYGAIVYFVAFVAYALTVRFGFVYDDTWTIVENPFIRDWHNLRQLMGTHYLEGVPDSNRPIMLLSEMLDYAVGGLRPGAYHLQNVIWHAVASFLVFRVAIQVLRVPGQALLAGLLFAVHPMHSEAVAAINYREDLLATVFALAAWLALKRAQASGRRRYLGLGLGAALVASFAKESALALPLVMIASDWVVLTPSEMAEFLRRRLWQYLVLLLLLLAAFVPFYAAFHGAYASENTVAVPPLGARLSTTARIVVHYLAQLALPLSFSAEYTTSPTGIDDLRNSLSLVALVALVALALRGRHRAPSIAWGTAWFFVSLVPVANLVPINNLRADRYVYLPSVGFCIAYVCLLTRAATWIERQWRVGMRWRLLGAIATTIALATGAVARSLVWRDSLALWTATVAAAPDSQRARAGLALAQAIGGAPAAAIATSDEGLLRFGGDGRLYMARGIAHSELGDNTSAIEDFRLALPALPRVEQPRLWNNLGVALRRMQRLDEAEGAFRRAVFLVPDSEQYRRHLAEVLEAERDDGGRVPE